MKRFLLILAAATLLFAATQAQEQDDKWSKSYNYMCGLFEFSQENYDKAAQFLTEEIEEHPQHLRAWQSLTVAYCMLNDTTQALRSINGAIASSKKGSWDLASNYLYRATIHLDLMLDTAQAIADCSLAIKACPDSLIGYWRRGVLYRETGQLKKAKADMERCIKLAPNKADGYLGLAQIYINEEKFDKAIVQCDRALAADRQNAEAYAWRGLSHILMGQNGPALDDFLQALELDPDNELDVDTFVAGLVELDSDIDKVKAAIARHPENKALPMCLAQVYEDRADYPKAIEAYEALLADTAAYDQGEVFTNISRCFTGLDDYNKAYGWSLKAYQHDSTSMAYQENLASICSVLGRDQQVVDLCTQFLKQDFSQDSTVWLSLHSYRAGSLMMLHRPQQAVPDYDALIAGLGEPSATLVYGRGHAYLCAGDKQRGLADMRHCLEMGDSSDLSPTDRAMALHYVGRDSEALSLLDHYKLDSTLLDASGDSTDYDNQFYDLACANAVLGRTDVALGFLQRALNSEIAPFVRKMLPVDYDLDPLRTLPAFKALLKPEE